MQCALCLNYGITISLERLAAWALGLNSSQAKIKYEFSKPFPCDCGYVQQKMVILDILTRPFSEKYKSLKNVNDKEVSC